MAFKKDNDTKFFLKTPFFYGWIIVGMGALASFFSGPGQTFSISIFIDVYIEHFGWSRTYVSGIYSAATLVSGLLIFSMGRLIDRFGHRTMAVVVGLSLGLACLWSSFIFTPWMLFVAFLLLRYFGQGSMMILPVTLIPQWFVKKRGIALSIAYLGNVMAFAMFPPINNWIINNWGPEAAWMFWAFALLFLFTPITYLFIRNKPEHIGLSPYHDASAENNGQKKYEDSWTLKESSRAKQFWLILFCRALPPMIETGIIFHMVSIMGERGILPSTTAFIMTTMAVVSFLATFLAGFIADRVKAHYILAASFLVQIVAMLLLLTSSSVFIAFTFGILWGITMGFEKIAGMIIWPNYFGREHIGSIIGVERATGIVSSALGPVLFGFAFDQLSGYREMIIVVIAISFLGILAAIFSTQPQKKGANSS